MRLVDLSVCACTQISSAHPDSTSPVPMAMRMQSNPTTAAAASLPVADARGRSIFHTQDRGRDYSPLRAVAQVVVGDGSAKHLPPVFAASVHMQRAANSASGPRLPVAMEAPLPFVARPFAYQPPPYGSGSTASGAPAPASHSAASVGGYAVDARGRASMPTSAAAPVVAQVRRDRGGTNSLTASVSNRPW
jgi:hypothetical protein